MTTERDVFQASYLAWKTATEKYEAHIDGIINGTAKNDDVMNELVKDMAKKHADFMNSSKPFVRWK